MTPKRPVLDEICFDAAARHFFEIIPGVCFFIKDLSGRLIHCNEAHRRGIFRYGSADTLYGKINHDFFPNALVNSFADDDRRVIQQGETILEQCELNITSAGVLSWFCTTKIPARNRRGRIIGLLGISRVLEPADKRFGEFDMLVPAIRYMQAHFAEKIRISSLAKTCQMKEATFRREFERFFRITPLQFLLRLRLHEACLRLSSHSDSVGEIAYQCGFDDQNYFARYFKKTMAVSPTEFRAKQNAGL